MTLGVHPEAVVRDPLRRLTILVQRFKATQDVRVGDPVAPASARSDQDATLVQQSIDVNPHALMTTDPTSRLATLVSGLRYMVHLRPLPCSACSRRGWGTASARSLSN
jgi:hypothetical protein